jgi:hypothetical protein
VAELVERLCACAERFGDRLGREPGMQVLARGLNQVLVRPEGDAELVDRAVRAIQREGTCWVSATTWRGERCIRISVSNWQTSFEDVDRSLAAMLREIESAARERALG